MKTEVDQLAEIVKTQLKKISQLSNEVDAKDLEKQDLLKDMLLGIIEVLDTFERVEQSLQERNATNSVDCTKIINRYKTIHNKILGLLEKHKVLRVEFPDNRLIVGVSRIVETEPDDSKKNDEIIAIVRHGYVLGHEVIREAELIVVKN